MTITSVAGQLSAFKERMNARFRGSYLLLIITTVHIIISILINAFNASFLQVLHLGLRSLNHLLPGTNHSSGFGHELEVIFDIPHQVWFGNGTFERLLVYVTVKM